MRSVSHKIYVTKLLCLLLCQCVISCNDNAANTGYDKAASQTSTMNAGDSLTRFEGRFYRIEKLNDRDYRLYLKNEQDSIVSFLTVMPLDSNEISMLKTSGNNMVIQYSNFYDSARKVNDRIVRSMTPVYEFKKQ
jgi:hypothetical protein